MLARRADIYRGIMVNPGQSTPGCLIVPAPWPSTALPVILNGSHRRTLENSPKNSEIGDVNGFNERLQDGVVSRGFVRGINLARTLGWGMFSPLLYAAFVAAEASTFWFVFGGLMSFLYPQVVGQISKRISSPISFIVAGLVVESATLTVFAEVVGMDPVFLLVGSVIMVFNAGSVAGRKASLLVVLGISLTLLSVEGHLRATPQVQLPRELQFAMVGVLALYIVFTTHQTFVLLQRQVALKRTFRKQKQDIERLQQHVLATISNPFLSDEEILTQIGPQLDERQARQYRDQIRSRQTLESLGRRVRGIGHDARNMLQPMIVLADMLEDELQNNEEASEWLADFDDAAKRLTAILEGLGQNVAGTKSDTVCDLPKLVAEVCSLLRASSPRVLLEYEDALVEGHKWVRLDSTSLHRAVANICINGIHAMHGEGTLHLSVRPSSADELGRATSDRCVTLCIKDHGVGMNEAVLQQIFTPYFSTRQDSGGTGLGLANAQALVSDCGGAIFVESEVGIGTEFFLVLPLADEGVQEVQSPPSAAAGGSTVPSASAGA